MYKNPEDGGRNVFRNVSNHSPVETVLFIFVSATVRTSYVFILLNIPSMSGRLGCGKTWVPWMKDSPVKINELVISVWRSYSTEHASCLRRHQFPWPSLRNPTGMLFIAAVTYLPGRCNSSVPLFYVQIRLMHYYVINTTLFTLLHSYVFNPQGAILRDTDVFLEQGQQNTCPD
jgi:hypothetical protein